VTLHLAFKNLTAKETDAIPRIRASQNLAILPSWKGNGSEIASNDAFKSGSINCPLYRLPASHPNVCKFDVFQKKTPL